LFFRPGKLFKITGIGHGRGESVVRDHDEVLLRKAHRGALHENMAVALKEQ